MSARWGWRGSSRSGPTLPYEAGRGSGWVKAKCTLRQEFVILGYVPSTATGRGLRSLVVGYNKNGKLQYGGRVGTGFSSTAAHDLKKRLDRLVTKKPPVVSEPARDKQVVWTKPQLVAEVEFRSWTTDGILRQASFQGLREDKPWNEVVAEMGGLPPAETKPARASAPVAKRSRPMSVTLSSPDKLLWPEAGISKQGLLDYYEKAWPRIERFIVNRPLSLVRAPDGIDGQRFFQKHASKGMHEAIIRTADPEDGEELLSIRDFDGLAALVQFGVVEVHIWGSTLKSIEKPDQIVFDLDPDEGLGPKDVRRGDAGRQAEARRARPAELRQDDRRQGLSCRRAAETQRGMGDREDLRARLRARHGAVGSGPLHLGAVEEEARGTHLRRLSAQRSRLDRRGAMVVARQAKRNSRGAGDVRDGSGWGRPGRFRHRLQGARRGAGRARSVGGLLQGREASETLDTETNTG